jgi:TetR/AcrR family transcriptional regulator, cholesterol catabolism regulator
VVASSTNERALNRQQQIVDQAATLFDSRGYHATTMEDIASAVGLAKPTLYHYYKSKDDILYAIHEEFIDLLLAEHAQRATNTSLSVDNLLLGIIGDILDLMRTHRGHVRVFFEHHRELPTKQQETIRRKRDEYFSIVEKLIQRGIDEGSYETDYKLCTLHLFGMCNWAYQWYNSDSRLTPREIAKSFWLMLRDGIATR